MKLQTAIGSLLAKSLPTLVVIAILGMSWLAIHRIHSEGQSNESEALPIKRDDGLVKLPPGKFEAIGIHVSKVETQVIQHRHQVAGRIQYDESRHIEIKTPLEGILAELLVKPGDLVEAGQLLAVIKSPEIGQARSEVLRREQFLEIVQQRLNRERDLSKNLYDLLDQLERGKSGPEIDEIFANRPLGSFRQELLSAYTQLQLAQSMIDNSKKLGGEGAIAGRTLRERETELAIAMATFRTLRDQSAFSSKQAKMQAEADVEEARRQCDIARQSLESLLGYAESMGSLSSDDRLSRLEVHAPFSGTIENRMCSPGERMSKGDTLLTLADTASLYVAADIREADWLASQLEEGALLTVTIPALDSQSITAKVHYLGRTVSADSNAVPMVATIANEHGWLRPGMFVRVSIPMGKPKKALAVHPTAVVQHDQEKFVFIEIEPLTYRRANVVTGLESDDWIEVIEGLVAGQSVVDEGAFLLKSELLLEGESE